MAVKGLSRRRQAYPEASRRGVGYLSELDEIGPSSKGDR